MELDDFIAVTLSQIIKGVEKARKTTGLNDIGARPSASRINSSNTGDSDMLVTKGGVVAQVVRFDVALTVTEHNGSNTKIGIVSGFFNGSGSTEDQNQNSSISRVQFSIPIVLPEKHER